MQEENREGISGALKTLAAVVIVFLLLAALYVGYQAMQVLFPPNTYETALLATVEDTVDAEGVLLFEESYVAGGGTLGYLVADGERVSAGTAVAEIYSCLLYTSRAIPMSIWSLAWMASIRCPSSLLRSCRSISAC